MAELVSGSVVSKWQMRQLVGKADWPTWKTRIEYHISAAAADVMLGRSRKPSVSDPVKPEEERQLAEWQTHDREAVTALLHCVNDDNLQKISRFSTSRERWLELVRLYDGAAGERAFDECMKFFSYQKRCR